MTTNIAEQQKILTVVDKSTGEIHSITIRAIRDLAAGRREDAGLSKVIALAMLEFMGK